MRLQLINPFYLMETIEGLLDLCLSNDTKTIADSEKRICDLLSSNFFDMIAFLTKILNNEDSPKNRRRMAVILIKNTLKQEEFNASWEALHADAQNYIKSLILATLVTSDYDVLKLTASCIAQIAKIEFPKGKWKEILSVLVSALKTNENSLFASALCLEYICQDILLTNLESQESQTILFEVFKILLTPGLNEKLVIQLLKVVRELVPFMKAFFKDNEISICEKVFNIEDQTKSYDIKVVIIEILIEIFRHFYDYLQKETWYRDILRVTVSIMNYTVHSENRVQTTFYDINGNLLYNDYLAHLIIELWVQIATIEGKYVKVSAGGNVFFSKKNKRICEAAEDTLAQLIINKMSNTPKIVDDDSWNIIKACSSLLLSLNECCSQKFIDKIFIYVRQNFDSQNIIILERTIICYASILESPYFKGKFRSGIESVTTKFFDFVSFHELRGTLGFAFERIYSNFSQIFSQDQKLFKEHFARLSLNIQYYYDKDTKFTIYIANCLSHLVKTVPNQSKILTFKNNY